jgi:hypothetical protein
MVLGAGFEPPEAPGSWLIGPSGTLQLDCAEPLRAWFRFKAVPWAAGNRLGLAHGDAPLQWAPLEPGETVLLALDLPAGPSVLRKLDSGFFRVRYDRMTPSERGYLRAMAQLGPGPHRSGDIAELLGMKVTSVGPLRSRLIRKGMVYAPAHGDTAFTVPLFDQFMQRQMPDWTAEPGGRTEEDA